MRSLLVGLAGAAAMASAGDQPAPSAAPLATTGSAAPQPPAAIPSPAPPADIPDFVPSEKVSADDAVAFPTDI